MNLFLEEARTRRRKARDRIDFEMIKERLRTASIVLAVSLSIPFATPLVAEWIRRRTGPGDPEVMLWWPASESHAIWPVLAGILVGLVFGAGALARGDTVFRRLKWVWAGLAVLAGASALMSLDSSVRIMADRVVVADGAGTATLKPGAHLLANADQVVVRCRWIDRRRDSDYATVDYWVHFAGGSWVAFHDARPENPAAAREWFRTVVRLDRTALIQTPHAMSTEPSVSCIRSLRVELGEEDFAKARRMMGLSDADFTRYYAEPHEAFRRRSDDGL